MAEGMSNSSTTLRAGGIPRSVEGVPVHVSFGIWESCWKPYAHSVLTMSMEEDPRPKACGPGEWDSTRRIERTRLIPYPLDLALSRPIS